MSEKPVVLMDASLYVFRAWHALAPEWRDDEGWPTHAVHGFTHVLLQVLEQLKPAHLAVCFDNALSTSFRNDFYPAYKANREPPDVALTRQFTHCQSVARALGIASLCDRRFEADDLIGTLAHRARQRGRRILVLSADKDLTQLLREGDEQWDFGKDRRYGPNEVEEKFGVRPEQIVDWLALAGDAIDNIPGVNGIGPQTAARLLKHFGTLDAIYRRINEIEFLKIRGAGTLKAKLKDQRDNAYLSQRLSAIATDAPTPEIDALAPSGGDPAGIEALFERLGFGPLMRRRALAANRAIKS
jgi:5'-3' exonuclease